MVCQEGYTSSLAAAALQELGIWRATDLIGGYAAWQRAGFVGLIDAPARTDRRDRGRP